MKLVLPSMSIMPIRPIGCRCMAQDDPAWHNKECWIRQTDALRRQLTEATYRIDVLEPEHTACQARAAAAEGERDRLENAAEHWHALYMDCAAEKADAAARYGQEIVDLEQGLAAAYLEVRH